MTKTRSGRGKSLAGVKYTNDGGENPIEGVENPIEGCEKEPEQNIVEVEAQVLAPKKVNKAYQRRKKQKTVAASSVDAVQIDTSGGGSTEAVLIVDPGTIATESEIPIATDSEIPIATEDVGVTDSGIPIAGHTLTSTENVIDTGIPTSSGAHPTPSSNILGIESGNPIGAAGPITSELPLFDHTHYDSEDDVKVDTTVLLGKDWPSHIGFALLKDPKARGIINCKSHIPSLSLWNHENECDDFKERLVGNPLVKLVNNSYQLANRVYVSAFVERWQPETNTFHLPFGEMTVTLEDVRYITGLPVIGKPLNYELGTGKDHSQWVHEMLGIRKSVVVEELSRWGGQRVSKSWLKKNLAGKAGSGEVPPVISVDQAVRGYLLYILCCTLFCNHSGDKISIAYLHFLEDLDSVSGWAWGAATLAHLYRQFSQATRVNTKGVSGYISLFESWVYEHFKDLRPEGRNEKYEPTSMFRNMEWKQNTGGIPEDLAMKLLVQLREQLDLMAAQDVIWDAYKDVRAVVPDDDVCWYYGCIRKMDIVEAYHPNRVVRQFGHVQLVPQPPIPPKSSSRSGNIKKYTVSHESCDDDFIHYVNRLVHPGKRGVKSKFDWECDAKYMKWYCGVAVRRLTRVHKKKQRDSRQDDANKARVLASLEDTMLNIKQKGKKGLNVKHLSVTLQMAWDFISSGVCTGPEAEADAEAEPEVEEEELEQGRKKRARIAKKK